LELEEVVEDHLHKVRLVAHLALIHLCLQVHHLQLNQLEAVAEVLKEVPMHKRLVYLEVQEVDLVPEDM
tara:strand:- start:491 stop:697 length:207 start_codon:yes stop_codon:yes gene_type:complete